MLPGEWQSLLTDSTDSPQALKSVISGRRPQPTANSDYCFSLAATWIRDCLSNHQASCPHDARTELPTRVIDVGINDNSTTVHLVETKGLQGVWVSLSHCWGRIARFVTESSNITERMQGIELSELPLTFLDAIRVTRALGYQYVWIDSLCILQDSYQDWVDESSRMQDYYSKAILTIASDLAAGDHESFLDNPRLQGTSIEVPFNTKGFATTPLSIFIFKDVKDPGIAADATPLSERGWTLQEDILSPRSLHYTSTELIFECQQSRFVETDATPQGYNDVDQMTSIKRFFLRPESGLTDLLLLNFPKYAPYYQPITRWYRLFKNYCQRILTFESDRLAAIAGLAREIGRQTGFAYKAGIWEEDLHNGLLWTVQCRGSEPQKYRAPSWSWASLDTAFYSGHIINPTFELYMLTGIWRSDENIETCRRAEILGCEVDTANGDPFGPVLQGRLKMRGYALPFAMWKGVTTTYVNVYWRSTRSYLGTGVKRAQADDQLICDLDVDRDYNVSEDGSSSSDDDEDDTEGDGEVDLGENEEEIEWRLHKIPPGVVLFQIQRLVGAVNQNTGIQKAVFVCLMLVPIDDGDGDGDVSFRRVGIAEVPDFEGLGHNDWKKRDVKII